MKVLNIFKIHEKNKNILSFYISLHVPAKQYQIIKTVKFYK